MIDHDKNLVERLARLLFWQPGGDRWTAAKDIDKDGYRRNAMGLLDEIETAGFHLSTALEASSRQEERLSEARAVAELALLYNHADDDSRQFTRWQMVTAIQHGYRIALEPPPAKDAADV